MSAGFTFKISHTLFANFLFPDPAMTRAFRPSPLSSLSLYDGRIYVCLVAKEEDINDPEAVIAITALIRKLACLNIMEQMSVYYTSIPN